MSGRQETTATGPAWQVREVARNNLLEKIKQQISEEGHWEERYTKHPLPDVYHTWFYLLHSALRFRKHGLGYSDLSRSGWAYERWAANLLSEISKEIEGFEHSQQEGNVIFAKLIEWVASEIGRPYHSALTMQEMENPKLIYGTERATDEILFE